MGIKNKKQSQKTQRNGQKSENPEFKFYLKEFSGRLLLLVGSFVVAGIVGFEFKDIIQTLVTLQLADLNTVNFAQAEGTLSTIQISLFAGVLGGLPFATYHVYRFFAPILARGAWYGFRMVLASTVLLVTAVVYAFMVTIPLGLASMVAAAGQDPVATQTFLSFAVGNVLTLVLLSQLPVFVIFLNGIKSFSTKQSFVMQGSVVVATVFAAGFVTPSVMTGKGITGALLLVVPAIVLFEASMIWAKLHGREIIKELSQEDEAFAQRVAEVERPIVGTVEYQSSVVSATSPVAATQQLISPYAGDVATSATEESQPTLEDIFDAMLADDDEPQAADERELSTEVSEQFTYETSHPPVAMPTPQVVFSQHQSTPVTHPVQMPSSPSYRPQPLPQPRPIARRQQVYARPITDMLRPGQVSTPQLRSLNTPRPTIPFQTTVGSL